MGSPRVRKNFVLPTGKVDKSVCFTDDSIGLILQNLDCPRALSVWLMYSFGEHDQLVQLSCNPEDYSDSRNFRSAYQATHFLRKSDFLRLSVDPEVVAIEKFLNREIENAVVNRRFNNLSLDPLFKGPNVWLLNAVTCKIRAVLGDFDDEVVEEWFDACRWGPGSTSDIRGRDVSSANKFQSSTGATQRLITLLSQLPDNSVRWDEHLNELGGYVVTEMDSITCVSKDARSHRVIGIPVAINSYYQLGVGKLLRRRIRRHLKIDLDDQSRNGRLAYYGAVSNRVCTVDFSSASDSNCYSVVRELFPSDWFDVLEACRVPRCNFDGISERVRKEKLLPRCHNFELFSAMGCGFTFELETLIFATAALAVCEYLGLDSHDVSVFGDDVVLPTEAFELYRSFCSFLGYTINREKSFSSGMFRESCGEHYYGRTNVKPFYLKSRIRHVSDVYLLANNIRRWSHRNLHYGCDPRLYSPWHFLRSQVPKKLRFCIPEGYGDGGFSSTFDEATPHTVKRMKGGLEGFACRSFVWRQEQVAHYGIGVLLARLHAMPVSDVVYAPDGRPPGDRSSIFDKREPRAYPKVIWMKSVSRWVDLGPWLH